MRPQQQKHETCLYLISGLPLSTQVRLVAWLLLGFLIYFSYSRRHSKLHKANMEQVKQEV